MNNVAGEYIKTVMLRKFFQMVFVGNDRKTLNIYTATVLGGSDKDDSEKQQPKSNVRTSCISELDRLKEFCMKFGFIVTGNDDNEVESIVSENVTEENRGFLSQVDCIQQVWGKECSVLYNDQTLLESKYRLFMGYGEEDAIKYRKSLASLAKKRNLWIEDESKKLETEMCAIAIPGYFSNENYKRDKNAKTDNYKNDGNETAFYRISVPKGQDICKGIELLNWVKTTIRFKHHLNDQNLNFSIIKSDNTRFIAPDFTWYFSPPVKSFISYESSSAEVGWRRNDNSGKKCPLHEVCECPVKPEANEQLSSQRYDNIINPVANKTTVNFVRWAKDEMISYRQKYRITAKNIFTRPKDFDNIKELNIFIDTTDEHGRGNRQYILGIMISFALAFGIDKTRLGDAQRYFPFEKLFLADTWWLFMIAVVTLNLLIRPVRVIRKRRIIYWRRFNLISSLIWIFIVFCVDRSQWITAWFKSSLASLIKIDINYFAIFRGFFVVFLISNILYIAWDIIKYHDPVISSLFGEDIL